MNRSIGGSIAALAIAAAAAISGPAGATTTLTLSGDIPLQAGGFFGVQALFDMSPYLTNGGQHFHLTNAHISASGTSDAKFLTNTVSAGTQLSNYQYIASYTPIYQTYYYRCGFLNLNWCSTTIQVGETPNYATGTKTENYQDIVKTDSGIDTMMLKVGGQSASVSDSFNSSATAYAPSSQTGSGNLPSWTINYQRTVSSGYYGDLAVGFDLSNAALADATTTGSILANIIAGQGQFRLFQVSLSFDVAPAVVLGDSPPPHGGDIGPVPEPANWAMMMAGFGLIGAALRSRKHGRRSQLAI